MMGDTMFDWDRKLNKLAESIEWYQSQYPDLYTDLTPKIQRVQARLLALKVAMHELRMAVGG